MKNVVTLIFCLCLIIAFASSNNYSFGEEQSKETSKCSKFQSRLELGSGLRVGQNSDEADGYLISFILDFSKKISPHSEISIRTLPLFIYIQNNN